MPFFLPFDYSLFILLDFVWPIQTYFCVHVLVISFLCLFLLQNVFCNNFWLIPQIFFIIFIILFYFYFIIHWMITILCIFFYFLFFPIIITTFIEHSIHTSKWLTLFSPKSALYNKHSAWNKFQRQCNNNQLHEYLD